MTAFDDMVNSLVRMGYARETAEKEVREQHPELAGIPVAEPYGINSADYVAESREQTAIYKLFRAYHFKVRNLSQARASKQGAGWGDAWVVHETLPIAFWWESKRPRTEKQLAGELSPAQIEMKDDCVRCGVPYHHGDSRNAAGLLVFLGLAVKDPAGVHGIAPTRKEVQTVRTPRINHVIED